MAGGADEDSRLGDGIAEARDDVGDEDEGDIWRHIPRGYVAGVAVGVLVWELRAPDWPAVSLARVVA
ncbi:hypothetical protein, partial [Klebsiella pneumoniae]|uniref:hypothetical protein n=1 Tax=Klebsiella pneumoniae TaxID=573 RepID=UPI00200CADC3